MADGMTDMAGRDCTGTFNRDDIYLSQLLPPCSLFYFLINRDYAVLQCFQSLITGVILEF